MLAALALKHKNINLYQNEINLGLTKSLNILISKSTGQYIARQDGDDYSHVDRIYQQIKLIESSNFDIVSIDQIGYPDYLEYDLNESRTVLSWWNYKFVRKSDKKEISLRVHFVHDFNKEGKITGGSSYYNASLFQ